MFRGTSPDSHAWETAWENDVHPGGQMLFLSPSREPVLLLLLFITLKQDPWRVFTAPRFPSVLHASMLPFAKRAGAFVVEGGGRGGSKNLQRGLSSVAWICGVWVINHASIHVKPLGVQTILRAAREEPIWAPSSIYTTTKQEHSIYCTPYIIRIQWRPYRARGLEHIVGGH